LQFWWLGDIWYVHFRKLAVSLYHFKTSVSLENPRSPVDMHTWLRMLPADLINVWHLRGRASRVTAMHSVSTKFGVASSKLFLLEHGTDTNSQMPLHDDHLITLLSAWLWTCRSELNSTWQKIKYKNWLDEWLLRLNIDKCKSES